MSDDDPKNFPEETNGGSKRWDEDEPPPTEEERREAAAFGSSVERLLDGAPDGNPTDELVTSRMIRASLREEQLAEQRRDELIQQAMQRVLAEPEKTRHSHMRRLAPVLALAASLVLVLGAALMLWRGSPAGERHTPAPKQMVSRSSDDLMGRPFEDRAGASRRLDLVFADRMDGYRQVLLARGTP